MKNKIPAYGCWCDSDRDWKTKMGKTWFWLKTLLKWLTWPVFSAQYTTRRFLDNLEQSLISTSRQTVLNPLWRISLTDIKMWSLAADVYYIWLTQLGVTEVFLIFKITLISIQNDFSLNIFLFYVMLQGCHCLSVNYGAFPLHGLARPHSVWLGLVRPWQDWLTLWRISITV